MTEEQQNEQSPMQEADRILKEITEQNKILRDQLDRAERMEATHLLSGTSSAGKQEETEDDKQLKAAKALIAGTGYEDDIV